MVVTTCEKKPLHPFGKNKGIIKQISYLHACTMYRGCCDSPIFL